MPDKPSPNFALPFVQCVQEDGKWYAYAAFRGTELGFAKADTKDAALQQLAERLTARLANLWYAWHDQQK